MTADIFTKPLPQPAFIRHNLGLGLTHQSVSLLQHSEFQENNSQAGAPVRGGVVDHRHSPDHHGFYPTA